MKTAIQVAIRAAIPALACFLASGCVAADSPADTDAPMSEAGVVDRLPLQPGYYVAADTPCGEAANHNLHILREDGSGYGGFTTPPYFCEFKRIEQTGPSSFRAIEACGNAYGDDDEHTLGVAYEILDDTSYRAKNDDGWESSARRCPRRQLPALWRDSTGPGDFVE